MVAAAVAKTVRQYLRAVEKKGLPVSFGVIFGSMASGRADPESDIDLIVVSPRFDKRRDRREIDLLWRLAPKIDSRIEPIPCGERQWREDDSSTIVETARRSGEKVLL